MKILKYALLSILIPTYSIADEIILEFDNCKKHPVETVNECIVNNYKLSENKLKDSEEMFDYLIEIMDKKDRFKSTLKKKLQDTQREFDRYKKRNCNFYLDLIKETDKNERQAKEINCIFENNVIRLKELNKFIKQIEGSKPPI